eukprot:Skav236289  [mRNA]  locus=scaffold2529:172618:173844:+ [translate_table: standard]
MLGTIRHCLSQCDSHRTMQMKAASSVKKELVRQPGNTPVATRRRLTRRHWPKKLQREVASSVKKEHLGGAKVKKERIDEQKAADLNCDPWWQVRCRLEEMIGGANLQAPLKEKMLLANITQQLDKLIRQKKFDRHAAASEDASAASAAKPAPPAEWPKPTRFLRNNLVKQSGVPHIIWEKNLVGWKVQIPRSDSKDKKIGRMGRLFAVKKFLVPGRSESEADASALEAAKAFRAELVQQGVLSDPKPRDPEFTSEVPGVTWNKQMQKWQVRIYQKGGKMSQIHGGCFAEKAVAEAKALELREQHGLERQVKPVSNRAELPIFSPKVSYPGVKWEQGEQQWRAQFQVGGANRQFRFRPKDHSEEELDRSFKVAVAWRKKQEKENRKPAKPKGPPVKKKGKKVKGRLVKR